ncbi:FimV/HubP family polar landmark protein [Alcanivorax sp. HI0044]|uniref:FimV/HubP family polar landmark protein n=6 Tax=unclassified Alcanivorax TaxID=2638842 RepID=UPI000AE9168B|nr:FimV/HubP family polar landmark protein [Alcanivorax sp. HI0044]
MLRKLGFGLTAVAMMAPGVAAALGVGEYQLNSYLNQPLDMDVSLHEVGDLSAEEILVNLAPQSEFDAAGVDRSYFLNRLEFSVELQEGDKAQLHISTDQPVREPYLNFLVEFLWPTGRLMREYTVLLDPPSFADSTVTAAPTISRVPQPVTRSEPTPAPAPAAATTSQPDRAPEPAIEPEPQQVQSAPAVADNSPRNSYTVRSSDTMWQIALNNRPSNSVSVQQMLVAIQEMNPDAFINNNVNLVREGTVLRIPNEQEVRTISTRSAIAEVADQNRQWRDMLEKRGIQTPQRAQIDGSRQVTDSDDEAETPTRGEVKLVAPESTAGVDDGDSTGSDEQGSANTAVLENELAIRDESLDRLDRENSELKSRLRDLEEQSSTSEQLLKLRNDQISQLQEELRQLREEQGVASPENDPLLEEPAAPEVPAEDDATADVGEAGDSVAAADATQEEAEQAAGDDVAVLEGSDEEAAEQGGVTDAGDAEESQSVADTADDKDVAADSAVKPVEPVSKPEPVAPAQPPVAQSGGIVDLIMENLLYILLGVLVIVLLIVLLLRGKKKNDNEDLDEPLFDDVDDQQDDEFGLNLDDESAPAVTTVDEDDAADAPPVQGQGGSQDPLEDVEVYVAYGRYPQAVDFLRNEINKSPERADLKVRLLELLKEMGDDAAFQQQATAYAGTGTEVDAAIARLGGAPAPSGEDDEELSLDDLEMGLSSDLDNEPASAPTIEAEAPSLEPESTDELADFDFELDSAEADNDDATVMLDADSEASPSSASAQDDDFSLDFDSDDDAAKEVPEMSDADKQSLSADSLLELDDVGSATLEDDTEFGDLSLDEMNAEFDDLSAEPAADEELDLSLDDLDLSDETGAAPQSTEDDTLADLDIDLELDEAEKSLGGSAEGDDSLDDITSLDLDAPQEDAAPMADAQIDADQVAAADDGSLEDLLGDDDLNLDDDQTLSFDAPEVTDTEVADVEEPTEEAMSIEPAAVPDAPADDTPAPSSADVLADEDDFDFLGETDENATKLDLAKAYIDMGDNEGAKDILNEVISEGNDQQQSEARELLSQVG